MTRYYFNLVNDEERIADNEGVDIPENNIADAILNALVEIRSENPGLLQAQKRWSVEVTDGVGRTILTLSLERAAAN